MPARAAGVPTGRKEKTTASVVSQEKGLRIKKARLSVELRPAQVGFRVDSVSFRGGFVAGLFPHPRPAHPDRVTEETWAMIGMVLTTRAPCRDERGVYHEWP